MGDPSKVMVALGMFATIAVAVKSVTALIVARAQQPRLGVDPVQAERLNRIEQAVDAIALEVERISEGQRFTTRLLAERGGERLAERSRASEGSPLT